MDAVFTRILNMGIAASIPLFSVILLRLFLKKTPKWLTCALWGIAAARLVCPFFIQSAVSLIPSRETISLAAVRYAEEPVINSGIFALNRVVNPILQNSFAPSLGASVNPLYLWMSVAGILWAVGAAVLLGYAFWGCILLHRRVREAVLFEEGVWLCDSVGVPFILGTIRPRIYLPSGMGEEQIPYVLAHEKAHIMRKDHWWKPLAYLLLSVYWFHPLVWAAYFFFGRDIELACDEKAVKDYGMEQKKAYSHVLVSCSMGKKQVLAYPLAFGERSVKERVKAVLKQKKPAAWASAAAIAVCILAAVCFWTDPPEREKRMYAGTGESRRLTLDDVSLLVKKGEELDWADFDLYEYYETGSGLYIRVYEIDSVFSVWIGGGSLAEKAMYVQLRADGGSGEEYVDMRSGEEEIRMFMDGHRQG